MLLDSNIIIYAAQAEHAALRKFVADHAPAVSVISSIEVLGYHRLREEGRQFLERFFRQQNFCRFQMPWCNGLSNFGSGVK